jgi:hypothetical protein
MAAKPVNVSAAWLVSAASAAADHLERAAQPGLAPTAGAGGSPADAAAAGAAAAMRSKVTALSAELAGSGPQLQATGRAAASGLQSQDDQNAAKIRAVSADLLRDQDQRPHNGIQALNHTVPLQPPPVLPEGRVICTPMMGSAAFGCSEFLPGGRIFHWLSPVDFTGHWPD